MKKIGLGTILSIGMNLFLLFWLFSQYEADQYFQTYVNTSVAQLYPFIVLTIGVGGGSGIGYLILKRKHGDQNIAARIQKAKSFRALSTIASPSSSQTRNLPTGAPPSPSSKHTAYAVPPLSRNPAQSVSRGGTGPSWSTGARAPPLGSSAAQRQDTPSKPSSSVLPFAKSDIPRSPQTMQVSVPRPDTSETTTTPRLQGDVIGKPGAPTPWRPESAGLGERQSDSGPIFQKPGLDVAARPDSSASGRIGAQPSHPPQQTQPPGTKWQPPELKTDPAFWTDSSSKSPVPPAPSKWTPPGGPASPQSQAQPPLNIPPRPGGIPQRPPIPGQQMGPRPFVYQGPVRPGQPGPMGVPGQFRPDQNRPPPGMSGQQRPPQPQPRPTSPLAGPMPQPWTPPRQTQERNEPPGAGGPDRPAPPETRITSPSPTPKGAGEPGAGGEMDWDTALDTILKTLRKDRVGEKQ